MKFALPWNRQASVYDRAGTAIAGAVALNGIGLPLFFAGHSIGWFFGAAGMLLIAFHPKCPRCRKSPMRQPLISRDSPFYYVWQQNRLWPEHVCSQCGLDLAALPNAKRDE